MTNQGTTLTFHFPHGLGDAETKIMASAMAELIKLDPQNLDDADWRFAIEGSPLQAYELGVTTAGLVGALEHLAEPRP